jgi:hypothetical protein
MGGMENQKGYLSIKLNQEELQELKNYTVILEKQLPGLNITPVQAAKHLILKNIKRSAPTEQNGG